MITRVTPVSHPFEDSALNFPVETAPTLYYVICSTPRSGSSFLARELWRTGACGAPHEYFNYYSVMWRLSARLGTASLHDYARRVLALRTGPNGVFGFKAHLEHFLFFSALTGLAQRYQPMKYIMIEREDLAAQAVSYVMARETGQWFAGQPAREAPPYDRQMIDEAVLELKRANAAWNNLFKQASAQPLRLGYEAICADVAGAVRQSLAHLGIDAAAVPPIEHLPAAERQDNPLKAEWLARYRAETAGQGSSAAG